MNAHATKGKGRSSPMHWGRGGDVGNAGHPMGQLVVHTVTVEGGKVQAGSVCKCRPTCSQGRHGGGTRSRRRKVLYALAGLQLGRGDERKVQVGGCMHRLAHKARAWLRLREEGLGL